MLIKKMPSNNVMFFASDDESKASGFIINPREIKETSSSGNFLSIQGFNVGWTNGVNLYLDDGTGAVLFEGTKTELLSILDESFFFDKVEPSDNSSHLATFVMTDEIILPSEITPLNLFSKMPAGSDLFDLENGGIKYLGTSPVNTSIIVTPNVLKAGAGGTGAFYIGFGVEDGIPQKSAWRKFKPSEQGANDLQTPCFAGIAELTPNLIYKLYVIEVGTGVIQLIDDLYNYPLTITVCTV